MVEIHIKSVRVEEVVGILRYKMGAEFEQGVSREGRQWWGGAVHVVKREIIHQPRLGLLRVFADNKPSPYRVVGA